MRAAVIIAIKDLRLRVRDRSALIVGIAAPFGLAFILNAVIGGAIENVSADLAVVDPDRTELGTALAQGLEQVDEVGVTEGLSEREARQRVDDGDLGAAIVLPAGFAQDVDSVAPVELRVIGNVDDEIATEIAKAVADVFADRVNAARLSIAMVADEAGDDPAATAELIEEARGQSPPVSVGQGITEQRFLDTTTYLTAGMSVLFLFFLVQFGVQGLIEEREQGTLARLLVAPVPRLAIPVAKGLVSVVLGLVALTVLILGSTLLMGADWGDPASVLVLSLAVVLAAISVIGIVTAVARTSEQANNAQTVIAMMLALLGGSFFPINQGESFVTKLALLTPHHWFLRGLGEGSVGGLTDALPAVGALLAFALVVGAMGGVLVGWSRGVRA